MSIQEQSGERGVPGIASAAKYEVPVTMSRRVSTESGEYVVFQALAAAEVQIYEAGTVEDNMFEAGYAPPAEVGEEVAGQADAF
jgi:hypothetical protein